MSIWDAAKNKDVQITMGTHDEQMLLVNIPRTRGRNFGKLQLTGRWKCFSSTHAFLFVSQVLKGQRRGCHRESSLRPGAKKQNYRDTKLKQIYDTSVWVYTCLTCTTCHLSYITSLISRHTRPLKFAPRCYRHESLFKTFFGQTNDRLVYCLIYRLDQRPETHHKRQINPCGTLAF